MDGRFSIVPVLVDALEGQWHVVAPDARGFGLSDLPVLARGGGQYWFPEYLGDLDALLDHYSSNCPVNLVRHSLGANVVCLYAGLRPQRVRRIVDLEGFGMSTTDPSEYPQHARAWLDDLRHPPQLQSYSSPEEVAARLTKTNPRLAPARAHFLAKPWSKNDDAEKYQLLGDPANKQRGPLLYQLPEVLAAWKEVSAKVLHVEVAGSKDLRRFAGDMPIDEFRKRFEAFPDWRQEVIEDAGHMIHHDQPEQVASLIEQFCAIESHFAI